MEDYSKTLNMRVPSWMVEHIKAMTQIMDISEAQFTRGMVCLGFLQCFKKMGFPVPDKAMQLCDKIIETFPNVVPEQVSFVLEELEFQTRKVTELFPIYMKEKKHVSPLKKKRA